MKSPRHKANRRRYTSAIATLTFLLALTGAIYSMLMLITQTFPLLILVPTCSYFVVATVHLGHHAPIARSLLSKVRLN